MRLLGCRIYGALVLFLIALPLGVQSKRHDGPYFTDDSSRGFVEGFYSWYVPRALNRDTTIGWYETLKLIRPNVSSSLAKLLEEDHEAQSKCKDLIGLDFDPFLYSQEPAEHYKVEGVVQINNAYRANIYRMVDDQRAKKPDVVAEFIKKDGHWLFVNFHYPEGSDLLTILQSPAHCVTPRQARHHG